MKILHRACIVLFGIMSIFPVWKANAEVTVQLNQQQLSFDTNPRLTDVLVYAADESWYWPASSLYQLNTDKPEALRQQVLATLATLAEEWQGSSAKQQAVLALSRQIIQWKLAERIAITIDYDLARVRAVNNPRFENGDYLLQLKKRPASVYPLGLIESVQPVTHHGAADVNTYLAALSYTTLADTEWVYILPVNGKAIKVGTAYFNTAHTEVMPGGQIFIPFKVELFSSRLERLNQQIIELAAYRIFP